MSRRDTAEAATSPDSSPSPAPAAAPAFRVALVSMPFASCDRPSLALGLLKAALTRVGVASEVKYFNLTLWKLLGHARYHAMAQQLPNTVLAGEWVFSQLLWGEQVSDWDRYAAEVLDDPIWGAGVEHREVIREALALAPTFLRLAFESNDWSRFDLVGFTSTFEQTFASLCLARMIRAAHPEVQVILGGANFEAEMGLPYLEQFPFLDYVSIGEADASFPLLCQRLATRRDREPIELPPGILGRDDLAKTGAMPVLGQALHQRRAPAVVEDLDALPTPDFDEYFKAVASFADAAPSPGHPARPWLPIESSRGCWWGQKQHCTFCGLNGETMGFRRKQAARVEAELTALEDRYGRRPVQFADNILAHDYFADLIPRWAEDPSPSRKFFEIKANLRRGQVEALARAGVAQIQPGIESLDDASLAVMRKGVSAAQNLALLRWSMEAGIRAYWNVLFGFPREPLAAYARQLDLFPDLCHLVPPTACSLIRLDRFSPNFDRWREQGFRAVEPLPAYRHLFPVDPDTLGRMAYFFRYDHPQLEAAIAEGRRLVSCVRRWREAWGDKSCGRLELEIVEGEAVLVDTRARVEGRPRGTRPLAPVELAALLACDGPRKPASALERAAALDPERAEAALARLRHDRVIVELGGTLVSAALLPAPTDLARLAFATREDVASWLRRAR